MNYIQQSVKDIANVYGILPRNTELPGNVTELQIKKAVVNIDEVLVFEEGTKVSFDMVQDALKIISILAHRLHKKDIWKKCKYYENTEGRIFVQYDEYVVVIATRVDNKAI